jgi:TetR/AcrR family transcriptional regulator
MAFENKRDESIRHILNTAMEIFASVGFAGARMDTIAQKADVNKAMIYYRIGNKKTLYAEVLHDLFGGIAKRIGQKIENHQTPDEKLRIFIRNILSMSEHHPYLPRFMMWELAAGGKNFPENSARDLAQLLEILINILREGVEKQIFIETNPFIVHMMVVGAMAFYRASAPIRERYRMMHQDLSGLDNKFPKDAIQTIEELVLRAVKR